MTLNATCFLSLDLERESDHQGVYECILYIYYVCCTCIDFYYLSALGGLVCCLYKEVYIKKKINACPFDYTAVAGSGKAGPVKSWVAVVTPTDRPKSVRNRCAIELFCGVVCVVTLPFWHFCWCRDFCRRTESDLFLFLWLEEDQSMVIVKTWWLLQQS